MKIFLFFAFFRFEILVRFYRSVSCLAIIDSGTSGIAIPSEYYDSILAIITGNKDCQELSCVGVTSDDFPVLLISLAPDNVFPLLPSDYTECSG